MNNPVTKYLISSTCRIHYRMHYRRPILLTLVAALHILVGSLIMLLGALIIFTGIPSAILEEVETAASVGAMILGSVTFVVGLVYAGIGGALFNGKMWGWWFAAIMTTILFLSELATAMYIPAAIQLIILFYLMTENTRGWFKSKSQKQ